MIFFRREIDRLSGYLLQMFHESPQERNVSKSKPLLPTITMSLGILVGGLLGAVIGTWSDNESIVVACYVLGFLAGAGIGAIVGWRLHGRRDSSAANSS